MTIENNIGSTIEILHKLELIPKYGWKTSFDRKNEVKCKPFTVPRASQLRDIFAMSFRYAFRFYIRKRFMERRLPFIDPVTHVPWRPIYGVPMGGIGSGAIGRGFRGEFCRSSLIPGMYVYDIHPADHFILTIRRRGHCIHQQVLSPRTKHPSNYPGLKDWNWGINLEDGYYIGLYPRSWTVYQIPEYGLVLICQQISPVIPNNYKETCFPVTVFLWKILNFNSEPYEVTLTFTWRGPDPSSRRKKPRTCRRTSYDKKLNGLPPPDNWSQDNVSGTFSQKTSTFTDMDGKIKGCTLERVIGAELPCCFGIASKSLPGVTISRCSGFVFSEHQTRNACRSKARPHIEADQDGMCNGIVQTTAVHYDSYAEAPNASAFWNLLQSQSKPPDEHPHGYTVPFGREYRKPTPKLAIAVSATTYVPAAKQHNPNQREHGQANLEFAITWHSPVVRFRSNKIVYNRRYVRWFREPGVPGAQNLLEYALTNWPTWIKQIEQWQNPILNNMSFPDWYKSAIFNELYYLTDGGTVWLDPIDTLDTVSPELKIPLDSVRFTRIDLNVDPYHLTGRDCSADDKFKLDSLYHRAKMGQEIGLFAYLEGQEYRMYNTFDVHHDASWALIKLWPKLQLALMYDCADLTLQEDTTKTYYIYRGQTLLRSAESAVPHDFGDPEDEPWYSPNAYIMYPTDSWKDLNSKFVLQIWRDWKLTRDYNYALYMLPILNRVIRKSLGKWDGDGDGIIENSGFPDQTYDTWTAKGLSAYTGGLWIACLYAAHDLLSDCLSSESPIRQSLVQSKDEMNKSWLQLRDEYRNLFDKARQQYDSALWTGSHYAYQETGSSRKIVMAGQLSGFWFLRVAGLRDNAVLPKEHVAECLRTIRDQNWYGMKDGLMGAINGTKPGPKQDTSNVQAEEFWVGVNYSLGATMIAEDMREDGLKLAGSCYNTIYNRFGLHYQTPEAYMLDGRFRCPGYMRPLAIWSIQHALETYPGYATKT